ncbi:hypothetical protein F2Q69_00013748 [Brassica cretica]|uniref:Uncharacterized protein n=1 Tax=Brassica cretica TaxID=69181 RepID=A0A8S9QL04_BRACR|nr:hypothetical protein F2Q69_00013748 [Brassica cretica]
MKINKRIHCQVWVKIMQQCSIPDNIPYVPDEYPRANTTEIGSHQSCRPVGHASIDKVASTSFDRLVLKMLKWINLSTIHTCLDCLKEPKLTSNTKPDIIACLGAWYTWDRIPQKSLGGQKEVNRAWWQPPLRLDSWKSVQSWSMIFQYKQTLTQERN